MIFLIAIALAAAALVLFTALCWSIGWLFSRVMAAMIGD